jgi:hypothetical protein
LQKPRNVSDNKKEIIEDSVVVKRKKKNGQVEYLCNINHHLHSNLQNILSFQSIQNCHQLKIFELSNKFSFFNLVS